MKIINEILVEIIASFFVAGVLLIAVSTVKKIVNKEEAIIEP